MAPTIADLLLLCREDGARAKCAGTPAKRFLSGFHGSAADVMELRRGGGKRKPWKGMAMVNDRFALVSNLMRVLAHPDAAELLHHRVMMTPFHEDRYNEARAYLRRLCAGDTDSETLRASFDGEPQEMQEGNVVAALEYIITAWMGTNDETGLADKWDEQEGRFSARYTTSGGAPAWMAGKVGESLPEWHRLLCEGTEFLCKDVEDVFGLVSDGPDLIAYFDPPYLLETRGTRRYARDVLDDDTGGFQEDGDFHSRLARSIGKYAGARVVVSYYQHERIHRLYPKPHWWVMTAKELGHRVAKNTGNSAQSSAGEAPEVFAMNFDPAPIIAARAA